MRLKHWSIHLLLLVSALGLTGFGSSPSRGTQATSFAKNGQHGKVTEAELQDDLLRFESQFNARLQSANQVLETSKKPKIRYRAILNRLIYGSNSLDIALGPSPESNLLDMVTFIELSRDVFEEHWMPKVFGRDGLPLEAAFEESSQQIWAIAEKVLNAEQRSTLQGVITAWRKKHPEQINVETVRLSAFSTQAGAKAAGLDQDVGGLFASVQQSTQAVDAARLFAERALYYAERAPFLLRLQARTGADEILNDASLNLNERANSDLLKELRQTLRAMQATLGDANSTVQSVDTVMGKLSKNPEAGSAMSHTITGMTDLLKEWNRSMTSSTSHATISQMAGIANQVDVEGTRFLKRLAWLGASLILLFWILFILAKLAYDQISLRIPGRTRSSTRENRENKAA